MYLEGNTTWSFKGCENSVLEMMLSLLRSLYDGIASTTYYSFSILFELLDLSSLTVTFCLFLVSNSYKWAVPRLCFFNNYFIIFKKLEEDIILYIQIPLGMENLRSLFSPFFKGSWIPKISENRKITIPSSIHKTGSGVEPFPSNDSSWLWGTSCWNSWILKK